MAGGLLSRTGLADQVDLPGECGPKSDVPNIWGPGQLFAYSGMDGPTRAASPMVAHTLGDRIGLKVYFAPPIELWCQGVRGRDANRRYPRCQPRFEIVTGDAIRLSVRFSDGRAGKIAFAPVDQDTIAGYTVDALPPRWSVGKQARRPLPPGQYVHRSREGVAVLAVRADGARFRFALAHDEADEVAAMAKADKGLDADVDRLIDTRKAWCEAIELPANLPSKLAATYRKAVCIMRVNTCTPEGQIRHRWTTPDRWPHRWMWLHDSAYHTAGHIHHFPDLARDMLLAIFDTQDEDGRISLVMRPDGNYPKLSQSPLLAWATRLVFERTRDRDFLAEIYPKLKAYVHYFQQTRAFKDTGLHRWLHSDESMDNSPRFDRGSDFAAIDLSCTLCREFEDMAAMAQALGKEGDANAWREAYARTADAINRLLWDESAGQYGDLLPDGSLVTHSTCVTFLPLFAGIVPADRAERLRSLLNDPTKFNRPLPVPTVAADQATFHPDMWRGPTWLNMNHLIAIGLERAGFTAEADHVRRHSIEIVHKWCRHTGCIYEFFDCEDQTPPFAMDRKSRLCYGAGATPVSDFHWSAALFVAMCRQLYGQGTS